MVAASTAGASRRRFWLNRVAIAVTLLTTVALGGVPGSFLGCVETVNACGNSAGPPDVCGPFDAGDGSTCAHAGSHCMDFSDCCGNSCVDGVCACTPGGGACMEFSDCCSKACTSGACEEASEASSDGPIGSCDGVCVATRPNGWDFPTLVWIGLESNAPPCPETASTVGYEGRADPSASIHCEPCQCGSPTGSCGLPATLTASSTPCPGTDSSAVHTPFDPPSAWDGGCTTSDAIDAGQLCDGGPCVQSLAIGAPTVTETGCTAVQDSVEQGSVSWGSFARSCAQAVESECAGNHDLCVPVAPPGFKTCVFQVGDAECPKELANPYSEQHVFFQDVMDTRGCTACTCSPPAGSVCSAEIFIYGDSACATVPSYAATVLSTDAECHDLAPGAALGSKSSSAPIYAPGACLPSGGETMGGVTALVPSTFCCIP
jgi:hypothetical protein